MYIKGTIHGLLVIVQTSISEFSVTTSQLQLTEVDSSVVT